MREISIENAPKIGEGAHGEVYRIEEDTIVKVYRPFVSMDAYLGEEERIKGDEIAKRAQILGCVRIIDYAIRHMHSEEGKLCLDACSKDLSSLL